MATPLVSIAIPLYRSERFVRVIKSNIKRIRYFDAEIIISDRHSEDNAVEILKRELSTDSRVRFITASDRIGWVDHYNLLLQQAKGKYFMWMPHDDTFPSGYVTDLVHDLEEHPEAWLSFGNIYAVNKKSKVKQLVYLPEFLNSNAARWHPLRGVRFASVYNPGVAFRGVFRRDRVIANDLLIQHSHPNDQHADLYWMFAIGLYGKLFYNPGQFCVKRYYESSTHYSWDASKYFSEEGYNLIKQYIKAAPLSASDKALVSSATKAAYFLKKAGRSLPMSTKRLIKKPFGITQFIRSSK